MEIGVKLGRKNDEAKTDRRITGSRGQCDCDKTDVFMCYRKGWSVERASQRR